MTPEERIEMKNLKLMAAYHDEEIEAIIKALKALSAEIVKLKKGALKWISSNATN